MYVGRIIDIVSAENSHRGRASGLAAVGLTGYGDYIATSEKEACSYRHQLHTTIGGLLTFYSRKTLEVSVWKGFLFVRGLLIPPDP